MDPLVLLEGPQMARHQAQSMRWGGRVGGQITWYLAERAKMGLMQREEGRLPAAPSAPEFGCQSQVSLKV